MLAINIDDVIITLKSMQGELIALGVCLLLAIVATVAVMKLPKATKKLVRANAWIAFVLALVIIVNLIVTGPLVNLINLVTARGEIGEAAIEASNALCTEIAEEGIVLVKNDGILPLKTNKVNTFGWSATNPVYGGTGSGSLSDSYPTVSLLEGLTNAGMEYNTTLTDFYTNFRATRPMVGMWGQDWTIPEPTQAEYEAAGIYANATAYSDTALIVLARSGGEGADLPTSLDPAIPSTFAEGGMFGSSGVRMSEYEDDLDASKHFLQPTNREMAMINEVTAKFQNIVLIINAANAFELDWVSDYPSIKAVLLVPGVGQTGFNALGEILTGKVNPSGKTADTYVADLFSAPYYNNIGHFEYDNLLDVAPESWGQPVIPTFVNYVDGIYVGYKFYETAGAEGLIDYDKEVVYPFGYGLSYTTFSQEMGEIKESNGTISFDVKVTNTGSVEGKDVVQVYYNPPYTNGGIEKSVANLVAFEKTSALKPGASETVKISFKVEDMASFDTYGKGCYVVEAGDYVISINSDAHNVIASKTYTVASDIVYGAGNGRSTDKTDVKPVFGYAEGDVTYLSRADHFANYAEATAAPVNFSMSAEAKAGFYNNSNYDPTAFNNASDVMPTTGAKNGLTLADVRGLAYEDKKWDDLLDQLSIEDMVNLIAHGGYQTVAIESVGKVQTIDCDGPASINNNFTHKGSIGFPAAVMIANTWNKTLAGAFGDSIGEMASEMGVSGWYAPAMNTHRSAFAGRNFEYFSEDGLLAGKMAAAAIAGAKEHGVYSYMKHFALNDQETNRTVMLCTWSNEQAIREIYLKPFEYAVKEGGAGAVMSAFNYIGNNYAGSNPELLNTVLRGEWGFRGFVETDYYGGYGYQDADRCIRGGNDLCLAPNDNDTNNVTDTTSATSVIAMRTACHNILYTTANSRAHDPDTLNPGSSWRTLLSVVNVIVAVLLIGWEFLAVKKFLKDSKASK